MEYKGIKLNGLKRLYGAVLIELEGEKAEMSLEWIESYGDKVTILDYVLVFDFTPVGEEKRVQKVLSFSSKEELIQEMQEVANFFEAHQ